MQLTEPDSLARVVGPVAGVVRTPLATLGYSGSHHTRFEVRLSTGERRRLMLKHIRLAEEWEASRTGDVLGREARVLAEPALAEVWRVFACPYLAFALERGEVGLLMEDLGEHLFPDVREPLPVAVEDALLGTLARLHARFWERDLAGVPGLLRPTGYHDLLGPGARDRDGATPPAAFLEGMRRGWEVALARVPRRVAELLTDREALADACAGLPSTLLHGDAKVANLVLLPDSRVSAFDGAMTCVGPATLELGWYLAVNSSRLARPKEAAIERYRALPPDCLRWQPRLILGVGVR